MRYLPVIILFLLSALCSGQSDLPRYKLLPGECYMFRQDMIQNTETENNYIKGNASLDIRYSILFEVLNINSEGNYVFRCSYKDQAINFFSPGSDISISSKNNAFSPIQKYLDILQSNSFIMTMSPVGEFLSIRDLDSMINQLYMTDIYIAGKHDLLIRTIQEAFGSNALQSLGNTCFFVYDTTNADRTEKNTSIYFNAMLKKAKNVFYFQPTKDGNLRIQGIGIIEENSEEHSFENTSLLSYMKGSQTYDYLFNGNNGWISEGISKQKIQTISVFTGHDELPDGLKIPSYTETEFRFKGWKVETK